jgi:hypothetical protein
MGQHAHGADRQLLSLNDPADAAAVCQGVIHGAGCSRILLDGGGRQLPSLRPGRELGDLPVSSPQLGIDASLAIRRFAFFGHCAPMHSQFGPWPHQLHMEAIAGYRPRWRVHRAAHLR